MATNYSKPAGFLPEDGKKVKNPFTKGGNNKTDDHESMTDNPAKGMPTFEDMQNEAIRRAAEKRKNAPTLD